MIDFEQAMQLTRTVSGSAALDDVECKGMYNALQEVPFDGLVVEVGCQIGRSSSLIAQCALGKFRTVHIDPYVDQPDFLTRWHRMMWAIGGTDHAYTHLCMTTEQAAWHLEKFGPIDLAFIDGDHEYPGVMLDLELVALRIKQGGLLTMHDYQRESLPGVTLAANSLSPELWAYLGIHGTLGIWRRK